MKVRRILYFLRKFPFLKWNGNHVLLILNGFILASLFYFHTEDKYEKQVFQILAANVKGIDDQIAGNTVSTPVPTDTLILRSLHLVHQIVGSRAQLFTNFEMKGMKADILQPVTFELMTGKGACGGFSYVLGRLLRELNIEVRFAQMKVNGVFGGHIVTEAESSNGWVVLDPLFDVYFTRRDGKLASFADVQQNWNSYKAQVPAGYVMDYNYADARYTNWEKISIVMPLLKKIIAWSEGNAEAEKFSLRTLALRKYNLLFKFTLVFYLGILCVTIGRFRKKSKRQSAKDEDDELPELKKAKPKEIRKRDYSPAKSTTMA